MGFKDLMARVAERRAQGGAGAEGAEGVEGAEGTKGEGAKKEPSKAQKVAAAAAGIMGGVKVPTTAEQGGDLATRRLTWLAAQNPWGNIKGFGTPTPAQPVVQPEGLKLPQEKEEEEEEEEEEEKKEGEENGTEGIAPESAGGAQGAADAGGAGDVAAMNIFDWAKMAQNDKAFTI